MIEFRQKLFSEYDAMRSLYVELMKYSDRNKFKLINSSQLLPTLKGNSVVIERFVISTAFGHRDRYRMYIKVGAKAKMPDEVRLPEHVYDKRLLNIKISFKNKLFSEEGVLKYKLFDNNKKKKKNNGDNNGAFFNSDLPFDLSIPVRELLGEALKYDKTSRSLVLEFNNIQDAIRAINILPFGLKYQIYLLEL